MDLVTLVRPVIASHKELGAFHSKDFLSVVQKLDKKHLPDQEENSESEDEEDEEELHQLCVEHGLVDDALYFPGVYEYMQNVAGGSLSAARMLIANADKSPVAFNWEGGRHHARSSRACGFCYVNDVVLAIMELQKKFRRVLCVDIDVHHGDGVEEAFYFSNRVMTVSFHQYGQGLYPGTGAVDAIGQGRGVGYNVNVALREGITDDSYVRLFEDIVIGGCVTKFKPEAIVLVCGADSLCGDPLGHFNLTLEAYNKCARLIRTVRQPTLVLGAGGYDPANTAKCFASVTAAMMSDDFLSGDIPEHDMYEFYKADDFQMRTGRGKTENYNTQECIDELRIKIMKNIETYVKVS